MKTSLIAIGFLAASASQAVVFDWENLVAPANGPSYSQTVDGITATVTGVGGMVAVIDGSALGFGQASVVGGENTGNFLPTRFDFSSPLTDVTVWFGDNATDDDGTVTLTSYGASNNVIAISSLYRGTMTGAQSLTVMGTGISYIIGSSDSPTNGNSIVWDNISSPVPEPATMLALGIPALAMLRRNRRNK